MTASAEHVKTWLITGTSRGIGRLLAERLLVLGHRVAATMRDPSGTVALAGDAAHLRVGALDVTDVGQLRAAVDAAFDTFGHIDVVVSNAGAGTYGAAEELTDRQIEHAVRTNLLGPIQLVRAVLPHLRAQGSGRIVQLSSMAGHIGQPGFSLYHATKWGVEGFFEALQREVAPFGIATTVLAPGRFPTSFYSVAERTEVHPDYAAHPEIRRGTPSTDDMTGDLHRLVEVIIEVGTMPDPPRRLLLGSDAYQLAHEAMARRLSELEAQRALAFSTDR